MRRAYVLGVLSALVAASVWAETPTPPYPFRYSTLERVGELAVRQTSEANDLSFTLSAETFDKAIGLDAAGGPADETVTEWRPVAFVPPTVKVTAISVAIPGSDAPASITVTPDGGASTPFKLAEGTETVSLVGADGIAAAATLRTYKSTTGVTLQPDHDCAFRFDASQVGTAVRNFYTINGAPHLRVTGTATITRHVLTIDDGGEYTLTGLLGTGFEDKGDHVIVVEFFGAGGTLSVDQPLEKAPLVIGSSVSSTEASTEAAVSFDSAFAVPLSLRDGEGGKGGLSLTFGTNASFNPSALLLACDVTLKSPVNLPADAWLATHDVPIPAGRTFRLELDQPVGSEKNLPNLSFADATSRLELASNAIGTDGNPLGIPEKYLTLVRSQSGTLVLNRDVEAPSSAFVATVQNLDTTLILTGDHTFDFGTLFTADDWSEYGLPSNFRSFTLIQESGKSSFGSQFSLNATERNVIRVEGGTSTIGGMRGFPANSTTVLDVADGATLTLDGLDAGTETNDGSGTLDLTVRGTLNLTGDVHMTPALRRTLRVEDGTIHATSKAAITWADGGTSTAEDYLTVSGGGTFSGPLTVDNVTGGGTLTIGEGATVKTLYAYNGTIEGTGMIGTFTGDLGDVKLGGDWLTGPGKSLAEVVDKAQNYHGTLGFTAGTEGAPKTIDFASVAKLTELPGAFRVNNHQNVTMRLDQYIDATVRWPSPATGVKLTLIESGAYGGEAEIPVVPTGVGFAFQYYDEAGELKTRPPTDYQREPSEDGVSDELTWENAVFTGQGAWIDVEFDKVGETYTSANTVPGGSAQCGGQRQRELFRRLWQGDHGFFPLHGDGAPRLGWYDSGLSPLHRPERAEILPRGVELGRAHDRAQEVERLYVGHRQQL